MISAIGYMVGCYILTRMFGVLFKNKPDSTAHPIPVILAAITIIVTLVMIGSLILGDLSTIDMSDFLR